MRISRKIIYTLSVVLSWNVYSDKAVHTISNDLDEYSHTRILSNGEIPHALPIMPQNFSTRIVRVNGNIQGAGLYCNDVEKAVNERFVKKIQPENYLFNILIACKPNSATGRAEKLVVEAFIDPFHAAAELQLIALRDAMQEEDVFGLPFIIESAKGVVIGLELNAMWNNDATDDDVVRLRREYKTLWFPNNYRMNMEFISDVRTRFYSQDKEDILLFLSHWYNPGLAKAYEKVLRHTNMLELYPERVFLMEEAPYTFTSHMHFYYKHRCYHYKNQRCIV